MAETKQGEDVQSLIFAELGRLREDVSELRKSVERSHENKVSHREWSQRNEHVNSRLSGLGREIGDLRTEIRAKSAPWWSVGAMVIATISVLWNIFGSK